MLLILAGVTLSLTLGENGLLIKTKQAQELYEQKQASEKLETILVDIEADKKLNSLYNQDDYLTKKLEENKVIVNGDIVLVDEWQFIIDRSVPKIMQCLGKGSKNEQIKLVLSQTVSSDYTKSTIKIEIEYEGEISYIDVGGEKTVVPEKKNGKYTLEKDILKNGTINVFVKDKDEKYQLSNIEIIDLVEDMEIWTTEDLVAFRNKVNKGAVFKGKYIKLMANIDLNSICGENIGNWTPIGTLDSPFYGTFDGNNYTISNIYIKNSDRIQGLFGVFSGGNIQNVCINGKIFAKTQIGGICGTIMGDNITIKNCKNNVTIYGDTYFMGGISGIIYGSNNITISNCENTATISSQTGNSGGIVGGIDSSTININSCKNSGIVEAFGVEKFMYQIVIILEL